MDRERVKRIRSKVITLGEVFDILNSFEIEPKAGATHALIRTARHHRTFKYVMNRVGAYTLAFFPVLLFTIKQKLNIEGRYSK